MASYSRCYLRRFPKHQLSRADARAAAEKAEAAISHISMRRAHRLPDTFDDIPRGRQPSNKGRKSRKAKLQRIRRASFFSSNFSPRRGYA